MFSSTTVRAHSIIEQQFVQRVFFDADPYSSEWRDWGENIRFPKVGETLTPINNRSRFFLTYCLTNSTLFRHNCNSGLGGDLVSRVYGGSVRQRFMPRRNVYFPGLPILSPR